MKKPDCIIHLRDRATHVASISILENNVPHLNGKVAIFTSFPISMLTRLEGIDLYSRNMDKIFQV